MEETAELKDPGFMVEGPNGSVIADPAKIPAPAAEVEKAARPEWLPEKFKTPEEMAASYKELEAKLGKPADLAAPTKEEAKAKGVDLPALSAEYRANGKLSAESLISLAEKGFSEAHVKAYVDGITAQATQVRTEFADVAGGEEQLGNVLKWAEANLPADEQKAYNDLLEAGNTKVAKIVLQHIVERYTAENGESPELLESAERVPSTGGVKPFKSSAEVVKAMNKPEYQNDPAYREAVYARLAVSPEGVI